MNLQSMDAATAATTAAAASRTVGNAATAANEQLSDAGLSDRFLKMLVAQMNNQDPLNPLDNAQITSQLAQINTVVGINQLNSTMGGMIDSFAQMQAMQAAQLSGRDVMVVDNALKLPEGEDASAKGGIFLSAPVDQASIEVKDSKGNVVRTIELGAQDHGVNHFNWDGLTDEGEPAAAGAYSFSVSAASGETKVPAIALSQHKVSGVQQGGGAVTLLLEGGMKVAYQDVIQIL